MRCVGETSLRQENHDVVSRLQARCKLRGPRRCHLSREDHDVASRLATRCKPRGPRHCCVSREDDDAVHMVKVSEVRLCLNDECLFLLGCT